MQDGKNRRRGPWSRFWRRAAVSAATAFLVPVGLALAPGPGFAAVLADPFHGLTPLSDSELAELRGGFLHGDWEIYFAADIIIDITGAVNLVTALVVDDTGLVSQTGPGVATVTDLTGGNFLVSAGDLTSQGFELNIGLPSGGIDLINTLNDTTLLVSAFIDIFIIGTGVGAFFDVSGLELGRLANTVNDSIIP